MLGFGIVMYFGVIVAFGILMFFFRLTDIWSDNLLPWVVIRRRSVRLLSVRCPSVVRPSSVRTLAAGSQNSFSEYMQADHIYEGRSISFDYY